MVLERYLTKEIMASLTAVLMVILLIFMGRYFARYLAWAAEGFISGSIVMDLLLLRTLSGLNMILPFGLYIGVLIAFGRMYKDSEMTAFAASGVGLGRVIRAVFFIALFVSAIVGVLSLKVSPWAFEKSLQIQEKAEASSEIEGVLAGQFTEINNKHEAVIYVEEATQGNEKITNVFVQKRESLQLDVFSAKSAHQIYHENGERYVVLVEGHRYQGVPGNPDFNIQSYEKSAVKIAEKDIETKSRSQRAMSSRQLWERGTEKDLAELYWRMSLPVSTLLLAIWGVLLSRASPRQGRFGKLFAAILVLIIYNNAVSAMRSLVEQGKINPEAGMWGIHFVALAIILFLYIKHMGGRWVSHVFTGKVPMKPALGKVHH